MLAVIDTVSDPDARDAGIRQIDNGATYLRLLREVYPQLRRVDYRISYTLPPFTVGQSRELIASRPEWLSLGEMCRLAECYPVDSVRARGQTAPRLRRAPAHRARRRRGFSAAWQHLLCGLDDDKL